MNESAELNKHRNKFGHPPAKLYHAATTQQTRQYTETGHILAPVRGFDTDRAAMVWAMQTGRQIILEIDAQNIDVAMMPDHHNHYGAAWWTPDNVPTTAYTQIVSPLQPRRRADDTTTERQQP